MPVKSTGIITHGMYENKAKIYKINVSWGLKIAAVQINAELAKYPLIEYI